MIIKIKLIKLLFKLVFIVSGVFVNNLIFLNECICNGKILVIVKVVFWIME